jgi:NAD(P)-dependent dehydrogenase (short-subunit alcohol dehydrogenase family)
MAEGGRIVDIATSILGYSFPFYSVYAASKASLEHFSRALAKELGSKRITANRIAPGALDTPFFRRRDPQDWERSTTGPHAEEDLLGTNAETPACAVGSGVWAPGIESRRAPRRKL